MLMSMVRLWKEVSQRSNASNNDKTNMPKPISTPVLLADVTLML